MVITRSVTIPADHRLMIDVPPEIPAGQVMISFVSAGTTVPQGTPVFGCAKGQFWMADDFDAPLEDLFECYASDYSDELLKIHESIKNPPYSTVKSQGERMFGRAKGLFQMADDFDAPLEDLKDYM